MDVTFPSNCAARLRQSGFTLIELIIALAIGVLLISMAVPAFSTMLNENRITTQIYGFLGQLNHARQAAITSGKEVTICKSSDSESCNTEAEWEDGWIAFIDRSGDHIRTTDEELLRVQQVLDDDITIRYSANLGLNNYVIFKPTGLSRGNGTFTFCIEKSDIAPRAVILARTGHTRIARKKPGGAPLTCPL